MRYALRRLAREKTFAAFATLTLALGIGATTTIFAAVDSILLRPLAYPHSDRLYAVSEFATQFADEYPRLPVNAAHFDGWLKHCTSCENGALLRGTVFNLTGAGDPERLDGIVATWKLFDLLGARAQLGRTLIESDDQPGAPRHVVIADSLWRRRFGADPAIVGRTIQLSGNPYVIVGVLDQSFWLPGGTGLSPIITLPARAEVVAPLGLDWASQSPIGNFNYGALMRLREGASRERAQEEMAAAMADAGRAMKTELHAILTRFDEQITGDIRDPLWLLFAIVAALLVIVCVNLGHLMLVRSTRRMRDAAIHLALGARPASIFGSVMAEGLLISAAGGIAGTWVAYVGVQLLARSAPPDLPRLDGLALNAASIWFVIVAAAVCGGACALLPALRMMRARSADALGAASTRTTEASGVRRLRGAFVGVQVGMSTVLLVVATLLGTSFVNLMAVERGFDREGILTVDIGLPSSRYTTDAERIGFHQRLLTSLEELPQVETAGLVSSLPLKTQMWGDMISAEGDTRPMVERPLAHFRFASPGYFAAMGIAVRDGRTITEQDRGRPVAVVSASAAERAWPGESPIGRRLRNGRDTDWVEVIGIVEDVRTVSLDAAPPPMVYVPYWDGPVWQGAVWGNVTYVARTVGDPEAAIGALRRVVRDLDRELPLADLRTMDDVVAASVADRRFSASLSAAFGVSALLLVCLGVYGAVSYTVSCRAREVALRLALGARPGAVVGLVLRQGLAPVVLGLAVGLAAAAAAGRLLSGVVFGIAPRDPGTLAAVALTLLAVALTACWLPARRASLVDPARTLHEN